MDRHPAERDVLVDEAPYDGEACARGECAQCSCEHPDHDMVLDGLRKTFGADWKHYCEEGYEEWKAAE